MQSARAKIMRWIDLHARTGMVEWDSNVYYPMDIISLLNLVNYAEDQEVATQAAMMVDLLLMDMGTDMFYGQYGTSHGRSKATSIKSAAQESTINTAALVWGLVRFDGANRGSIALATSDKYDLPLLIEAIGQDNPASYSNYERQSLPITEEAAADYDLSLTDVNDAPLWWGMGAFSHPHVVDLTVNTAREWDLWHYRDFRDMKDVGRILQDLGILKQAVGWLSPDANGVVTSEVNKVTYRTPDYILANAQDYRPGEKGYQQVGDGYIALYSDQAYEWQTEGPDAGQEVIALGNQNVWVVQMGRAEIDSSFEQFVDTMSSEPLKVDGLDVEFESPGNGRFSFGWGEPFTLDEEEIALRDYPRFENPYTQTAEFGTGFYEFEHNGERLDLDFENGIRIVEKGVAIPTSAGMTSGRW